MVNAVPEQTSLDDLSGIIIGAAIEVHRILGPGLLESAYEECMAWELDRQGMSVERQKPIPLVYKGHEIAEGYRLDLLVQEQIIVELKSVDAFQPIHSAQILTYLKLTGFKLGLLLNFKVDVLRNGIKRVVNNY